MQSCNHFGIIELIVHIVIKALQGTQLHLSQGKHVSPVILHVYRNNWEGRNIIFLWEPLQLSNYYNIQQTRHIDPRFYNCCTIVLDAGPTLNQHWNNVARLMGFANCFSCRAELDDVNLNHFCHDRCNCTTASYDPICGRDGLQYFTPCHAGCMSSEMNLEDTEVGYQCYHETFTQCCYNAVPPSATFAQHWNNIFFWKVSLLHSNIKNVPHTYQICVYCCIEKKPPQLKNQWLENLCFRYILTVHVSTPRTCQAGFPTRCPGSVMTTVPGIYSSFSSCYSSSCCSLLLEARRVPPSPWGNVSN